MVWPMIASALGSAVAQQSGNQGGGGGGGGFLGSPWFQMILGAMGQGQSGQNAGAGALAGLQNSQNFQRGVAVNRMLDTQARDREEMRNWWQSFMLEEDDSLPPKEDFFRPPPGPSLGPSQTQFAPSVATSMMPAIAAMTASRQQQPPMMQQQQIPVAPQLAAAPPQTVPNAPPQPPPGALNFRLPGGSGQPPPQAGLSHQWRQPGGNWASQPPPAQAPGGMLQSSNLMPMYRQMLKYPETRATGIQGILAHNQIKAAAANRETWGPMSPEQRDIYGVPGGKPAQISNRGKMSMPGSGGVNIDLGRGKPPAGYGWGPDGNLIPIEGGPATKPSAEEAKQRAQSEVATRLLNEVDALVKGGQDIGSKAAMKAWMASSPLFSWMVDLTPKEAKTAANIKQLGTILLAAVRGANVGPEEQERFEAQLPSLGQEKNLFAANLESTKRNLEQLTRSIVAQRQGGRGAPRGTPPPPPGFVRVP